MEVARIQFEGLNIQELTNYQNYLQDHLDEVHHQIQRQDDHPPPDQSYRDQPEHSDGDRDGYHQQALHHYDAYPDDYENQANPDGYNQESEYDYDWDYPEDYPEEYHPQYDDWNDQDEIQQINYHETYITNDPDEECFLDCNIEERHSVSECPINNPPYEDY